MKHFTEIGMFVGSIPNEAIRDCTMPGRDAFSKHAKFWVAKLYFIVPIKPAKKYLWDNGAWDTDEINAMTDDEITQKVFWLACSDLARDQVNTLE